MSGSKPETSLTRQIAFKKVLSAIDTYGDDIDEVLLQTGDTAETSANSPTKKPTSRDNRAVSALSAQVLKEGLQWCLEELEKPPGTTQLRTNADRFRAYELARKTYAGFVDLVRKDQKDSTVRLDRTALLRELLSRVDVYMSLNMGDPSAMPERRRKGMHKLRELAQGAIEMEAQDNGQT